MHYDFIPVSSPDLSDVEETYVVQALRSTWISSTGEFVGRFETEFAEISGAKYALAVSNGTVALHLAMLALGVGRDDEVIVPSLTFVATANAVRYVGAQPVFVDVDATTWGMDPTRIEELIGPRTRGIIVVHLYGHPCDMDSINAIAASYGLWVVEDAAEAHTARYKGRTVGSLSTVATFSFYGNKILTSGEGGAVTFSDPELGQRIRMLRGQGMDPEHRYFFPIVGYNYRLTNVACAILCGQMARVDHILEQRRRVYRLYTEALSGVAGIELQPIAPWAEIAPWMYSVTVNPDGYGWSRDELAGLLRQEGVETRPFFFPIHLLPPYREEAERRQATLPITEDLAGRGINLPTYSGLQDEQIARIAGLIRAFRRG